MYIVQYWFLNRCTGIAKCCIWSGSWSHLAGWSCMHWIRVSFS